MKVGDIVRVRLKTSPLTTKIGIVVREARKMFMAGNIIDVMIEGQIMRVKKEHVETIR